MNGRCILMRDAAISQCKAGIIQMQQKTSAEKLISDELPAQKASPGLFEEGLIQSQQNKH